MNLNCFFDLQWGRIEFWTTNSCDVICEWSNYTFTRLIACINESLQQFKSIFDFSHRPFRDCYRCPETKHTEYCKYEVKTCAIKPFSRWQTYDSHQSNRGSPSQSTYSLSFTPQQSFIQFCCVDVEHLNINLATDSAIELTVMINPINTNKTYGLLLPKNMARNPQSPWTIKARLRVLFLRKLGWFMMTGAIAKQPSWRTDIAAR